MSQLSNPLGLSFDKFGNLYISDAVNNRIRKISTAGIISTVAGDGTPAHTGDGGLAINAQLAGPNGLCVDSANNIYIADNVRVRFVDNATGIISTIAGGGMTSGDGGLATNAQVLATYVKLDKSGNLYVSEKSLHRVRKVNSSNIITTITGTGTSGFSGDGGLASSAQVNFPTGLAIDTCGNLYVSESHGYRIRKVSLNPNCFPLNINETTPLTFTLSPNPATSQITITSSTKVKQLHLVNAVGVTVCRAERESDKVTIDVSELPTGIYFLTVYDAHGNKRTEKILKQ